MTVRRLLAKSARTQDAPPKEATLPGHTALAMEAAARVLAGSARPSLAAIGLDGAHEERLRRIVLLAAFLHDLGKCSSRFQEMVRGLRDDGQLARHEFLSAWLFRPDAPLGRWARGAVCDEHDFCLALVAVAGHHRRFPADAVAQAENGSGTSIDLLVAHKDFRDALRIGADHLGLEEPPPTPANVRIVASRTSGPERDLAAFEESVRPHVREADLALLAVAKALLVAADVAGSAIPRSDENLGWITRSLEAEVPRDRLRAVVDARLGGNPLRPFQRHVAESGAAVTLVRAGCGTGKTVAAYLWAAQQHPGRRLWMTYPTTGTATEGFRDYVQDAEIDARLVHGRSQVDLDILSNGENGRLNEDADRLGALRAWGAEAVVCTADTVLGLLQNHRRGIFAWPALARSAVVFDEIHAYDDAMFGTLLRFLASLKGIPVLLMTASLPDGRLRALQAAVATRGNGNLAEIAGPEDLETLPRYRVRRADAEPWSDVERCLASGGKVLWVSNTVDLCVRRFRGATERGCHAFVYHSRYRYEDRVRRHGEVIGAFGAPGPAMAVTTQVAEMSLDLSADLLVTDLAPVPALIQRLGRLNRRSTLANPLPPAPCVVLPFRGQPYVDEEIDEARGWLDRVGTEPVSQADLVKAWQQQEAVACEAASSAWLDGGFSTVPGELREASPGLSVILSADAADVRARRVRPERVVLPMGPPPRGVRWESWSRCGPWPVAPAEAIDYEKAIGGSWRRT